MVFSSVLDEIEAGKNILPDSRQKYLTDPEENILPASDENISRIESENILENRKQSERSAKAFRFRANLLFVAAWSEDINASETSTCVQCVSWVQMEMLICKPNESVSEKRFGNGSYNDVGVLVTLTWT